MNKEIKKMRAELLRFVTLQCKVHGLCAMELVCDNNKIAYALWNNNTITTIALEENRLWADGKPMFMDGELVDLQTSLGRAAVAIERAIVRKHDAVDC